MHVFMHTQAYTYMLLSTQFHFHLAVVTSKFMWLFQAKQSPSPASCY